MFLRQFHCVNHSPWKNKKSLQRNGDFFMSPFDQITLLNFLSRFATYHTMVICELGVATGRTGNRLVEFVMKMKVANVRYYGIDDLSLLTKPPVFEFAEMTFFNGNRDQLKNVQVPIDFGFVDACHCSECVCWDAFIMSERVKLGGYMGFHDTSISAIPMVQEDTAGIRMAALRRIN